MDEIDALIRELKKQDSYERLFELRAYVEEHGPDTPLPEHLQAPHQRLEDRDTIEWLRASGSGWNEEPDAIDFLADWEAEINERS